MRISAFFKQGNLKATLTTDSQQKSGNFEFFNIERSHGDFEQALAKCMTYRYMIEIYGFYVSDLTDFTKSDRYLGVFKDKVYESARKIFTLHPTFLKKLAEEEGLRSRLFYLISEKLYSLKKSGGLDFAKLCRTHVHDHFHNTEDRLTKLLDELFAQFMEKECGADELTVPTVNVASCLIM